ncbi:MAG TPA: type II toxin-antitoxin system VapC family toxin [Planctomycetota bacterium]|nr:type II toxin-antitoxin system VapC family toxin [Planctomycetota bacterium]
MKKRVYIETTIPSFYVETRREPDMVARRGWTRQWWDTRRQHYEVVTSPAVIEELQSGTYPNKEDALALMAGLRWLPAVGAIGPIVRTYIARHVMPADPTGDGLHLAFASYYHCHFLLTWNCEHLANANKFEHIRHVNTELGLFCPILTTPVELLGDEEESNNETRYSY